MEERLNRLLGQRVCVTHSRGYVYGLLETWGYKKRKFRSRAPNADGVKTDASFHFSCPEVRNIDHNPGKIPVIWLTI